MAQHEGKNIIIYFILADYLSIFNLPYEIIIFYPWQRRRYDR